jgi:zinc protease
VLEFPFHEDCLMPISTSFVGLMLLVFPAGSPHEALGHDPKLDVHTAELPNGMRVVLAVRPAAPVVSVWTGYRVGSRDENQHETGLAHFLEHMMFKGTPTLPKGAIDRATQAYAGSNNAFTTNDMTAYFFDFPAEHLDVALRIEADRMRNCLLDAKEFEAEKAVVVQEIGMNDDSPWSRIGREVEALTFLVHPYHHPVLGWQQEIERLRVEDMRAFYHRYYQPNNATLVLTGAIDPEPVYRRIVELFGQLPRGPEPPRTTRTEPDKTGVRRSELVEPVNVPRVSIVCRTIRTLDPGDPVLDCLSAILGSGKSSRLHKRLVIADRLATAVSTNNDSRVDPGLFWINLECVEAAESAAVERAVFQELQRLAEQAPESRELERAINGIRAGRVFARETAAGVASELLRADLGASLDYLREYESRLLAVTADQVRVACGRFLTPHRATIVWSLPDKRVEREAASVEREIPTAQTGYNRHAGEPTDCQTPSVQDGSPCDALPAPQLLNFSTSQRLNVPKLNVVEQNLPNGLKLLLMEKHDEPVLALEAYVNAGQRYEPIPGLAYLLGKTLDTGAGDRTEEEIADAIEFVGGSLDATGTGVRVQTLAKDADLAIDLLSDLLQRPTFPETAVERERAVVLAEIAADQDDPHQVAFDAFRKLVYGNHPFARDSKGTAEAVRITRDDLVAFHKRFFVPANTVISAVGDFSTDALAAALARRFKSWPGRSVALPKIEPPRLPNRPAEQLLEQDRAQVNVYIGHVGISRKDPDYVTLRVLDNIYGTSPGFTDRLSSYVRDELGLCYSIGGSVTSSASEEPGIFRTFVGTAPDQWRRAHAEIVKQIERLVSEPVSDDELDRAKVYLTGSYIFQFQRAADVAQIILQLHRYDLRFDYPERYLKSIQAVTADQILDAARKHVHPDRLTTVAVGKVKA